MDVLGHMLDDKKYKVEGLALPKGGCVQDQTFTDDTAFYLKEIQSNLDNAWTILDFFYLTSRAKVNWGKSATIWAIKEKSNWEWGQEMGLKWISKSENLGIQVGFRLTLEADFDKIKTSSRAK
jgi:hypothetical protein